LRGLNSVTIIPNGADIGTFKPHAKGRIRKLIGLKESEFVIAYCGIVGGYYKLDIVVRSLARLDSSIRKIVKLLIVGTGPDLSRIIRMAENLGLKDNVLYLGEKNDKKELGEVLSCADVGVIPGLYAMGQLPVKFFEYCACGVPVVATVEEDSTLAKLIQEYRLGIVSLPGDYEKLAKIIHQLYIDVAFRVAAGKRARELIEKKFDRNMLAAEYLNLVIKYAV
jgi:glycosyltransferase involved in cell wall biosynthesis